MHQYFIDLQSVEIEYIPSMPLTFIYKKNILKKIYGVFVGTTLRPDLLQIFK